MRPYMSAFALHMAALPLHTALLAFHTAAFAPNMAATALYGAADNLIALALHPVLCIQMVHSSVMHIITHQAPALAS